MKVFFIKKNGEILKKNGTKSAPRIYGTVGYAANAISQLADMDRCKDRHECYKRLSRARWDEEIYDFCEDATPPISYYKEFYEAVEIHD